MSTQTSTSPQRSGYPPLSDLRRSRSDRKLAGVAGGLGQYAGVDPLIFRILFVVLAVFGGSGLLLYAIGWLLVPDEGETESEGHRLINGRRSRSTVTTVVAGLVALILGLVLISSLIDTGPGLGGLGVLIVVGIVVALLLRNGGHRAPVQPVAQAPTPPGEPGAFGQTPGTAYTSAPPPPSTFVPPTPAGSSPRPEPAVTYPPRQPTITYPPRQPAITYPVYGPPPPPPPPKERSILGRVTLCVALIVVGLLIGWNAATDADVPARVVVAAALGVVGIGLIVGAFAGRARGLVVWGSVLTLLAAAAAITGIPSRGGIGERTWTPSTVEQLRSTYRLGIGDSTLDLSRLDLAGAGRTRVEIRQGIGDMTVIIPDDVVVRVQGDVGAGEFRVPGHAPVNGTDVSERFFIPTGSAPGSTELVIDAELGVGSMEVLRATP